MIDYIKMIRIDHWIKNLFIFPGVLLAFLIFDIDANIIYLQPISLAFIASSLIASSNYLINEWLDRHNDAKHPDKKNRPAVTGKINFSYVILFYVTLLASGLYIAFLINFYCFISCLFFSISGIIYNVKPIRAKDISVIDVLVESFNNPIRLYIGWFAVTTNALIPLSLVLAYWFFGAFLMNCKRITDFNKFNSFNERKLFRPSLSNYNLNLLYVLALIYSTLSTSFFMTFAVRYKIEMIILLPLIVFVYSIYFLNSLSNDSMASQPERIMRSKKFLALIVFIIILFYLILNLEWKFLSDLIYYAIEI